MATTERDADYINRALINPDPGISDAFDYMGRGVGANDTDYMGRSLKEIPAVLPYSLPFELN